MSDMNWGQADSNSEVVDGNQEYLLSLCLKLHYFQNEFYILETIQSVIQVYASAVLRYNLIV